MKIRYWSERAQFRPEHYRTFLQVNGESFYVNFWIDTCGARDPKYLLAQRGEWAARILWNGVREKMPDVFNEAVQLGWFDPPKDCRSCGGRGSRVEEVLDTFRQALHGLREPMMLARVKCAACEGRGWA